MVGRGINTRDMIGFHGETIAKAIESFHGVVDECLEDCQRLGERSEQAKSPSNFALIQGRKRVEAGQHIAGANIAFDTQ